MGGPTEGEGGEEGEGEEGSGEYLGSNVDPQNFIVEEFYSRLTPTRFSLIDTEGWNAA